MTQTSRDSGAKTFDPAWRWHAFRAYIAGHGASNVGTWAQQAAELWLLLELGAGAESLAIHSALRFGPVLLFGAFGGLLADRLPRRRILVATQAALAIAAFYLCVISLGGSPSVGAIYILVAVQGMVNALDNPTRRAFVRDTVPLTSITSAMGVHGGVATLSRAAGPALAGLLIATAGPAWCFAINGATYVFFLLILVAIRPEQLRVETPAPADAADEGTLRSGLRYSFRGNPRVRATLLYTLGIAILGWNWSVMVPVLSDRVFGGDPVRYGFLMSSVGAGSLFASVIVSRRREMSRRLFVIAPLIVGAALIGTGSSKWFLASLITLALVGFGGSLAIIGSQARIQIVTSDAMSGRVLALYSVAFIGSKPIGSWLASTLITLQDVRLAFHLLGVGLFCLAAAVVRSNWTDQSIDSSVDPTAR